MTGITHETGMTPEQLEDKIKALRASHENLRQSWDESLTEAEAQRDELLAALKSIYRLGYEDFGPAAPSRMCEIAAAAISKMGGPG